MAATTTVTSSLVTIIDRYRFGGPAGKHRVRVVAHIVDATNGLSVGVAATDIPAAAFGLTKLTGVSNISVYTTSSGAVVKIYPAAVGPNLDGVLAFDPNQGTDANRANVAAVTASSSQTMKLIVEGY